MDNLLLIHAARALGEGLSGARLVALRTDGEHRFRLRLDGGDGPRTVVVSLRPDEPWVGRPLREVERSRPSGGGLVSFVSAATHTLAGAFLERVDKPTGDRRLDWTFGDGHRIVVELAPHRGNAVLLDRDGRVMAAARHPRRSRSRIEVGAPYRFEPPPIEAPSPIGLGAEAIEAILRRAAAEGLDVESALRRRFFGIGRETARLVAEEAAEGPESPALVLARRLSAVVSGTERPVIEAPRDPWEAARSGAESGARSRLLPWAPPLPPAPPLRHFGDDDPLRTIGRFHEAVELSERIARRSAGLRSILDRQIDRAFEASRRSAADLAAFEDPEIYRRRGEALLAGLGRARRVDGLVSVPDPYDEGGAPLSFPDRPGRPLQELADEQFRAGRKARRGAEAVERRRAELEGRGRRLAALRERFEGLDDAASLEALGAAMREEGIPVDLPAGTRAAREDARAARPRLEGVRVHTTRDGWTLWIGKTGRDNHRLTFRLASPDDFWFHALGCPGAHVILRNEDRSKEPPRGSLVEAAAAAAWFSEARSQPAADVQWTRRKYVRKPRGAASGAVILKRFDTIRVSPRDPGGGEP